MPALPRRAGRPVFPDASLLSPAASATTASATTASATTASATTTHDAALSIATARPLYGASRRHRNVRVTAYPPLPLTAGRLLGLPRCVPSPRSLTAAAAAAKRACTAHPFQPSR
ncbi:hypothetical protein CDD83_6752 [Cordyceps sp. RAO-2017]|nr:hypothetical protein CDD83_6752 [Cordyceps sp. RAO-2017]